MQTALDMIDADGIDALSMRKLGHALHRDPMRLYSHAESKEALLDAVAEMVLDDFTVPAAVDDDWEQALCLAAQAFRAIALAHPRMVPLLVTRPMTLPLGLVPTASRRWLEALITVLIDAGFDEAGAMYAYRFFTGFLAGHVLHEIQELMEETRDMRGENSTGSADLPHIGGFALAYDGSRELTVGLGIVLVGLRSQLHALRRARH